MGSGFVVYPVETWSKTGRYDTVAIDYSQDCTGLAVCEQPTVALSSGYPSTVTVVEEDGRITLTGPYEAINQAMLNNLSVKPGAGNPLDVYVKITASVYDSTLATTVTDSDSFIIPIDFVSLNQPFLQIPCNW